MSLRNYIQTISHGRADIEATVLDVHTLDREDIYPSSLASEFEAPLRAQGFHAAALVLNGGPNSGGAAEYPPWFWARFSTAEGIGVWLMELTHVLAYYMDLYTNDRANDLKTFDYMDCACGTHPTAYTQMQLGWLDPASIVVDSATEAQYNLHTLTLAQPAPPGKVTAVKIETSGNPLFVEARQRVDQYDGGNQWNWPEFAPRGGIGSEGVIVYELAGVQNPQTPFPGEIDPLIRLLTPTALVPGQSVTSGSGVTVRVTAELVGGYSVSIANPTAPSVVVPDVRELRPAMARSQLQDVGLVARFTGPNQQNAWVYRQSPLPGHLVPSGSEVTMVLRTGPLP